MCIYIRVYIRDYGRNIKSIFSAQQLIKKNFLFFLQRKHPDWKPSEDGVNFMSKLKESVDDLNQSTNSGHQGNGGRNLLQGSGMGESSVRYHPPGSASSVEVRMMLV